MAKGRLVVTNASANRTRQDVPVVNAFVNPGHIDELYEMDMDGRIMTGGNCMTDIVVPTVAALDREIGVKGLVVETLQGWSGAGKTKSTEGCG